MIKVLVTLSPDDPDFDLFEQELNGDPAIRERIDLRAAHGAGVDAAIVDAEVVVCGRLTPQQIDLASNLKWISFFSAGLDGKISSQMRDRQLILTNASGVHGPNIAEHVLCWMLMFTRRMNLYFWAQVESRWEPGLPVMRSSAEELEGKTLGIVGFGKIGESLAVRASAFGMRVIGIKRDPSFRHSDARAAAVWGMDRLPDLLAEADHLCISVPFTEESERLIDAAALAKCKPGAYLYNVARGRIIDESALIAALEAGRIAGAGLDVFEQEPLPADSPLWRMPNVLITPHTAGITPHYFRRTASLFADNLKRYLRGERLHNLYDPSRGY